MKRPWFSAAPVDESFFSSAPVVLKDTFKIGLPASRVWDAITAPNALHWCRIIGDSGIEWTSEKPYGVGTTRTVNALKGLSSMHEHFFIWDEGERKSFYVLEAAAPMFKRFAEDYVVTPTGETSCEFTWTIAYEPTLLGAGPVNKAIMKTLFSDTRKHFRG
ncbi:MAG: SRPBCC family protein [Solirubrobacterales bacterium]